MSALSAPAVHVLADPEEAGRAAGEYAAKAIRDALTVRGRARVMFAAAPSQAHMLAALGAQDLDWSLVEVFHLDEYIGLDAGAPQRFGSWLHRHLFDAVRPGTVHLLDTHDGPQAAAARYDALLDRSSIDLACIGIGNNGHIAFNEPYQWSLEPSGVLEVELDETSREQQVLDGCFASLDEVPRSALTLSVPQILRARRIMVTASGGHKRAALAAALTSELSPACPATALLTHPDVTYFIDTAADPRHSSEAHR